MESFYTELHLPLIIFSGIRVPNCKEMMIQQQYLIFIYNIYVIITDLIVFLSVISIGCGMFLPDILLVERCTCGIAFMACLMSLYKVIYCIMFPHYFDNIFKLWNNHFDNDPYLNDLQIKVEKQRRFMRKISSIVFSLVTPPVVVWGLLPYIPEVQKLNGGKFTVVPARFPFDITVSPNFELAVLFQTVGAVYVTSKNIAFDTIFYNLISRQTIQIKHLRTTLEKILSVIYVRNNGKMEIKIYQDLNSNINELETKDKFAALKERLHLWIKHHQHTIKIGNNLKELYSPSFVLLLLYEVFTICLDGFTLIASDIDYFQLISLTAYIFGNLLLLFVLCLMGDLLTYEWNSLTELGFGTNWFACSRNIHNLLKIIFQRCQSQFKLLGLGVYPVSSETFLSIIMSAYSYIMVLNQLKTKGHL